MALNTFDGFINRIGGNFTLNQPIWGELTTSGTAICFANNSSYSRVGDTKSMPSLPAGVTAFIPTRVDENQSTGAGTGSLLIAKVIDMGHLTLDSTTAGVFTSGSSMPTTTECGVSRVTASAVLMEVTTALSATPGSIQLTYTNQAGTASQTTTVQAMVASTVVRSCGFAKLASGDTGVQTITNAARSLQSTANGVIQFWGIIPISYLPGSGFLVAAGVLTDNLINGAFNPVRLGANDVIKCFRMGGVTTCAVYGRMFLVGDS